MLKLLRGGAGLRSQIRLKTRFSPHHVNVNNIFDLKVNRSLFTQPQSTELSSETSTIVIANDGPTTVPSVVESSLERTLTDEYHKRENKHIELSRAYQTATNELNIEQFSELLSKHKIKCANVSMNDKLCGWIQHFTSSHVALIIPAAQWTQYLGEIGFHFSITNERKTMLELFEVINVQATQSHVEVVSMMKGLALSNAKWNNPHITKKFKKFILSHVEPMLTISRKYDLESLLQSLGRLGVRWSTLKPNTQSGILVNLTILSPTFSLPASCQIIRSLGLMRMPLIEPEQQQFVFDKTENILEIGVYVDNQKSTQMVSILFFIHTHICFVFNVVVILCVCFIDSLQTSFTV